MTAKALFLQPCQSIDVLSVFLYHYLERNGKTDYSRRSTVPTPFPYWAYSLADHLIGEDGSRQTLVRRVVGHRQELGARGQVDQHPHHLRQVVERELDVHLDNKNGTGIVFTKGHALILSLL